eukprot:TRINITY_DN1777_c0_g1_i1.p3 TRINITY_DN1777_c0_g1~~TRINITY_DN1777_c0_g1_i1.p3  ORF type:complete len:80 (-),score=15.54 TRINITY_DN1777_c0_g1_i1:3-242(-)
MALCDMILPTDVHHLENPAIQQVGKLGVQTLLDCSSDFGKVHEVRLVRTGPSGGFGFVFKKIQHHPLFISIVPFPCTLR